MNGFDRFGFLEMMGKKYGDWVYIELADLLMEIVDDVYTYYDISKDQLVQRLADMLPDLSFGEVAQFVDDSCLTEWGRAEKREWKEAHK